jgi:aspartyl protease family protein
MLQWRMRTIIAFAITALVVAAITPKIIEHFAAMRPQPAAVAMKASPTPAEQPTSYSSRSLTIKPDPQGHFRVTARIDGRHLDFMVDTGASVIALTARDAARLGVRPMRSDYTATVTTANGTIKAAPTLLDAVELDGLTVRDVQALVLPDDALGENLLGLSFLSKLRRFEYAGGKLLLEQ